MLLDLLLLNTVFAEGGDRDSAKSQKAEKRLDAFPEDESKDKPTILKGLSKIKGANGELAIGAIVIPEFDFIDQDYTNNGERDGGRPNLNIADSKLWFKARVFNDKGFSAGYMLRLAPQTNKDRLIDRNYVWLKHDTFGTLELGNVKGPHDSMCKMAQALIPTGWLDGAIDPNYYNTSGIYNGIDPVGHTGVATKISWYSPVMKGFQFAVAYTPNTAHQGQNERDDKNPMSKSGNKTKGNPDAWFSREKEEQPYGTNHVQLAALFKKECGDWKFWISGSYMMDRSQVYLKDSKTVSGNGEVVEINKTRSYMLGGLVGYKDVALAVEFMDGLNSRLPSDDRFTAASANALINAPAVGGAGNDLTVDGMDKGNAGKAINVVGKWQIDDENCVALGFQHSWRKINADDRANRSVYTFAYTRKLMDGVTWFAEANIIRSRLTEKTGDLVQSINDIKRGKGVPNNRGFLVATGLTVRI